MGVIDRSERIHSLAMKLRQVCRMQISRIFGTVKSTSGRYKALIDLLERCYFMRAELNAIVGLLIKKGVITSEEWLAQWDEEMDHYFKAVAKEWPEIEFKDTGFTIKDPMTFRDRSKEEEWPA